MSDKCVDKHPAEKKVSKLNQYNNGNLPRGCLGKQARKGVKVLIPLIEGWKLLVLAGQSLGWLQALPIAWLQVLQLISAFWSKRFRRVHGLCYEE